jgi:hypothetical protein
MHSQARGEEPKVGNFLRTLKERERELEDLKAEFESPEGRFQVMTEICRKFSRYARQEFHLMIELSS